MILSAAHLKKPCWLYLFALLPPCLAQTLSVGQYHACACSATGILKCWGRAYEGQLGLGDQSDRGGNSGEMGDNLPAVPIGTGRTCLSVHAGSWHTCVVLDDQSLKCFGMNSNGQLGLGDTQTRGNAPGNMGDVLPAVSLGTGKTVRSVALGDQHTCASFSDGTVKCWGFYLAIATGDTLNRGYTTNQMGDLLPEIDLGTSFPVRTIYSGAGTHHTCALSLSSTIKCFGYNPFGQLGYGDNTNRGANSLHLGDNLTIVQVGGDNLVQEMSLSYSQTCAIRQTGGLKCWGASNNQMHYADSLNRGMVPNQMGDVLPEVDLGTGVIANRLSTGNGHACVEVLDNVAPQPGVKCYGDGTLGKLAYGDQLSRYPSTASMFGDNLPMVDFGTDLMVQSVGMGGVYGCALFTSNAIKCWGYGGANLGLDDANARGLSPLTAGDNLPSLNLGVDFGSVTVAARTTTLSSSSSSSSSASSTSSSASSKSTPSTSSTVTTSSSSSSSASTFRSPVTTASTSPSTSSSRSSTSTSSSRTTLTLVSQATTASTSSSSSQSTSTSSSATTNSSTTTVSSRTSSSSSSSATDTPEGETTTSTTASWQVLAGEFEFTADGVTVTEVRSACVATVAESLDVLEQHVGCTVALPTSRRLRRLQSVWQVSFTVEVPSAEAAPLQEKLTNIDLNVDSAGDSFASVLRTELQTSSANAAVVGDTFQFVDLVHGQDEAGIAGLQDQIAAKEASVLDLLFSSNNEVVEVIIDGYVAAAGRTTKEDILAAGSFDVGVSGEFSTSIPSSIFDSLARTGIVVDELAVVAMRVEAAEEEADSSVSFGKVSYEADVQGAMSINLFSGGGAALAVDGLLEPITFTLTVTDPEKAECVVWDEAQGIWTTSGLVKVSNAAEFTCQTTHLSFFAGVVRGFVNSLLCSQATLLTDDGFQGLRQGDWYVQLESCLLWCVLGFLALLLAVAVGLDVKRQLNGDWDSTCFLVAEIEDIEHTTTTAAVGAACVGICSEACALLKEVVGSSIRDMIDECMSKVWGFFGDARSLCEGILEVISEVCGGHRASSGLKVLLVSAMAGIARRNFDKRAYLNACASVGLHPDDDVQAAVEETGLHAKKNGKGNSDNSEGEDIVTMSMIVRHQRKRDTTLMRLHMNHTEKLAVEQGKATTVWYLLRGVFTGWFRHGPIAAVLLFSLTTPSSIRALHLVCDVMGSLAITTLFMSVSGGARSRKTPTECTGSETIAEMMGRLMVVGIASGLLATFPVSVLARFHQRKFVRVDQYASKVWTRQLQKWLFLDIVGWTLGFAYVAFCTLYVVLFFANVAEADRESWLMSGGISALTDVILIPLAQLLTPVILVACSFLFLRLVMRQSRTDVEMLLKAVVEEADEEEGAENKKVVNEPSGAPPCMPGELEELPT